MPRAGLIRSTRTARSSLQDNRGDDTGDRYGYDPYGQALNSAGDPQDEAALSADQQANPFRFEGHYYDAAFKTYDMKARAYLPEIGRFLQEDHYEAALGDQALETDPLTQDRYAFAGGNPLNNIEFDGHISGTTDQNSDTVQTQGGDVIDRSEGRTIAGPRQGSGPGNSGWTPRSTNQAAAGFRRFDALVQARHVPPPGQLTRRAAERFLAGFERAHDLTIGGQGGIGSLERESYLTALQQGDWYEIVGQLAPNRLAGTTNNAFGIASAVGSLGGVVRTCIRRCVGLVGWARGLLRGGGGGAPNFPRVAGGAPRAYEEARDGGKHAGFLQNYLGRSPAELERGIRSLERRIVEHRSWIENPKAKIADWDTLIRGNSKACYSRNGRKTSRGWKSSTKS